MKTFTQIEIANFLQVKQPTISKYLNNKLDISAKDAIKLNREFGIPFEIWENPKIYLQENDTKSTSKKAMRQGGE